MQSRLCLALTALLASLAFGCTSGDLSAHDAAVVFEAGVEPFRALLFSRTVGYRHDSIPAAIAALSALQGTGGYLVETTEDPSRFNAGDLARFRVVVFLMTTGDVLDDEQQAAFENWIGQGGGYLGIHSASDTEYDWPYYGDLVGAYFAQHPAIQQATVHIEDASHPTVAGLPSPWSRLDEW
jgi:cytochrome c